MATTENTPFNKLATKFDNKYKEFKGIEIAFQVPIVQLSTVQLEENIAIFQQWLALFTDLHSDITKEALKEDPKGHRTKYLEWLIVIVNRIQFMYLNPLAHRLNYLYNKKNVHLAIFSILFGLAITIVSLFIPELLPTKLEDKVDNFIRVSGTRYDQLKYQDSLLLSNLKVIEKATTRAPEKTGKQKSK